MAATSLPSPQVLLCIEQAHLPLQLPEGFLPQHLRLRKERQPWLHCKDASPIPIPKINCYESSWGLTPLSGCASQLQQPHRSCCSKDVNANVLSYPRLPERTLRDQASPPCRKQEREDLERSRLPIGCRTSHRAEPLSCNYFPPR